MGISVKQKIATSITSLWFVALVTLMLEHGVYADEGCLKDANEQTKDKLYSCAKDANDPNELWWSRWDAVVKNYNDANELLEAKWNAVVRVLQNKELEQELKKKIIDKIMSPIFDAELMAKLALSKTHRSKLTAPQHKRFTELFTERIKNFYLEKTTLYKDEKVLFKSAIQKKDTIHIPMVMVSNNNKEVAMLYKLHKTDKTSNNKMNEYWKIYDVEIEGVSVLLTYRSQFDDILSRGGVNELFLQLEKSPTQ